MKNEGLRSRVAAGRIIIDNQASSIEELKLENERLKSSYDSMYSSMLDANQELMKDLKESQREVKLLCGIRLQTPSIGTRIVPKVDAPLTVSERVMEAVQLIVECGINNESWALYTQEDAHDVRRSKQIIDGLNETIRDLRMASGDMLDKFNDRARKAELYKKELNRLRRILGTADREINELSSQYCDLGDKLEKIERLVNTQDHRQKYVLLGRIMDIIMEK